jgi:hypothetical protein
VSRAQLLDDDQSPPSDSQVEDESQASQEDESETQEEQTGDPRVLSTPRASARFRPDDESNAPGGSEEGPRRFSPARTTCRSVQPLLSHILISQSLWESLLDARIRFQKALTASNRLPSHTEFDSLVEQTSTQDAIHGLLDEALLLSEDLFQLQEVRSLALSSSSAPLSSSSSVYLRRTVRPPLRHGNASKSTVGETMRRLFQSLHKRLQTWRARMPFFFPWFSAYSCSLCIPDTTPTLSRPSLNGPIKFNLSHPPSSCPRTVMPSQSPPATSLRMLSNSSPNHSRTRPAGPRWWTARGCIEGRESG